MSLTRKLFLFLGLPLVIVFAVVVAWAFQSKNPGTSGSDANDLPAETETTTAAACDFVQSPVDVSKATAILYPGQVRGGDYKPHGGFRFDNASDNNITVTAPLDAEITQASRYLESGEVQYLFDFKTDCGLEYRFDHLKTLSPKLQAIADTLPEAKVDDSRTTPINPPVAVTAGETIATAVGFAAGPNVAVDFGVYDKRSQNKASQDAAWAAAHADEKDQAYYAVCWLNLLPTADAAIVKALPGSGTEGKTSDYCL